MSWFNLFGTSWTWMLFFFPRLVNFLAVIFSNKFDPLLSLFSSGTSIMQILACLMLSQRSLNLFSFFKTLFAVHLACFPLPSPSSLIHSSASSDLLLIHSSVFLIPVIICFGSDWLFILLFFCSHCVQSPTPQVVWVSWWPLLWTLSGILHIFILFSSFSVVLSFFGVGGIYSSVSSFWITLCLFLCLR